MPIYEYICKNCGEKFSLLKSVNESDSNVTCINCKHEGAERIISSFSTASSSTSCTTSSTGFS